MNYNVYFGRLVADPELRYTQAGRAVTRFTIAVRRNYKNKDGKYDADFIDCVVWGSAAERFAKDFNKGNRVIVRGRMETNLVKDRNGNTTKWYRLVVREWDYVDPRQIDTSASNGYTEEAEEVYDEVPF